MAIKSVNYEASTLLPEPLTVVSAYQDPQNPYEKLSPWSFEALLTTAGRFSTICLCTHMMDLYFCPQKPFHS
jgi:hypothetical protein